MDARQLRYRVQLVQALLVGALAALVTWQAASIVIVYAIAFGLGLAETMAKVAGQKLVPAVVAAQRLDVANGQHNAVTFSCQQLLGPALGALMFTVGMAVAFWADMLTFVASALLVWRIAVTRAPSTGRPVLTLRSQIAEGFRWLAANRLLRTLSLLSGAANLANFMAMATFVLFAKQRVGVSDAGYGVLVAMMAVGGILGSLLSSRIVRTLGGRVTVTLTIFATPLAMLGIGLFARDVVTLTLLAAVTSLGASLWNVASSSLRQRTVPAELLGRVSSVGLLLAWGTQPIGALLGGFIAGSLGLAAPWLIGAGIRALAAIAALPALRQWR
jgi:Na+/melibiose symporter-like transporter